MAFENLKTIEINDLYRNIKHAIRTGSNILVFGPAGIGKTEIAIQMAKEMGFKHTYLNLSVLESPDLVGIPYVDDSSGRYVTKFAQPELFPAYSEDEEKVVLVVDELDKCKQELHAPMLELLHSRSINGKKLNIQAIIATAN